MADKLVLVLHKDLGSHMQAEIDSKEKFNFQSVHFRNKHPTNFRIIGVVIVGVVKKLCCKKNCCDHDPVDVEVRQNKIIPLDKSIYVDECKDKAFSGTRCILVYPFEVLLDANSRSFKGMEFCNVLSIWQVCVRVD